jgi:hypothetical protein
MKLSYYFTIILILTHCLSFCQSTTFITDRPSNSLTPHIINKNGLLTEASYLRSVFKSSNTNSKDIYNFLPQIQLRYGASNRLELRTGVEFLQEKAILQSGTSTTFLFPFVSFGVKYRVLNQRTLIPTFSILVTAINKSKFRLNTGIDSLFDYNIRLLFENKINDVLAINYSVGYERIQWLNPNAKYTISFTPNITIDENWKFFAEVIGTKSRKYSDVWAVYLASGIHYQASDKFGININGGYKIGEKKSNNLFDKFYYSMGLSYKFN